MEMGPNLLAEVSHENDIALDETHANIQNYCIYAFKDSMLHLV
jgi:hypothetical protein